jgi:hypothetical protein
LKVKAAAMQMLTPQLSGALGEIERKINRMESY